jgi:hypothetical protein
MCPHRFLKDKIPEEALTCKKPKVAHLCDFDFPIYIHIPNEKMTKLKPSSLKGVYVVTLRPLKLIESTFHLSRR